MTTETIVIAVVIVLALGGMYGLYRLVAKKNETPDVKPKKDGKPIGDEPKDLPKKP